MIRNGVKCLHFPTIRVFRITHAITRITLHYSPNQLFDQVWISNNSLVHSPLQLWVLLGKDVHYYSMVSGQWASPPMKSCCLNPNLKQQYCRIIWRLNGAMCTCTYERHTGITRKDPTTRLGNTTPWYPHPFASIQYRGLGRYAVLRMTLCEYITSWPLLEDEQHWFYIVTTYHQCT